MPITWYPRNFTNPDLLTGLNSMQTRLSDDALYSVQLGLYVIGYREYKDDEVTATGPPLIPGLDQKVPPRASDAGPAGHLQQQELVRLPLETPGGGYQSEPGPAVVPDRLGADAHPLHLQDGLPQTCAPPPERHECHQPAGRVRLPFFSSNHILSLGWSPPRSPCTGSGPPTSSSTRGSPSIPRNRISDPSSLMRSPARCATTGQFCPFQCFHNRKMFRYDEDGALQNFIRDTETNSSCPCIETQARLDLGRFMPHPRCSQVRRS